MGINDRKGKKYKKLKKDIKRGRASQDILDALAQTEAAQAEEKRQRSNQVTVENLWKELNELAINLSKERNQSLLDTWINIKKEHKNKVRSNVEIHGKIMEMIETEIDRLVREDSYFKEVEYVTRDFGYLMDMFPEATLGHSNRKFQSTENCIRFFGLRDKLIATGEDEASAIDTLLKDNKTDIVTRTILQERQRVMRMREGKDARDGR